MTLSEHIIASLSNYCLFLKLTQMKFHKKCTLKQACEVVKVVNEFFHNFLTFTTFIIKIVMS